MDNSIDSLSINNVATGYSKYSSSVVDPNNEDNSPYLDFDSYLKVLAAQMSNQDFNDPMSDTEMLQQMSSYSMLEGIKNMTNQSNISYASSLVGKAVTVNDGENYDTGIVEAVVIQNGKPYLSVNGGLFEHDKVTDICDVDLFNKLSTLIGHEVDIKTSDSDGNPYSDSGTVTNVLMVGGSALVVVDGKHAYPLDTVSIKKPASEEGSEDDSEDGSTDLTTETSGSAEEEIETNEATAESAMIAGGYRMQSEALFNELMSTIDAISGSVTETAEASTGMDLLDYNEEVFQTAQLEVPDYAAGVFAQNETVDEMLSIHDFDSVKASEVNPLLGSAQNTGYTESYSASVDFPSQQSYQSYSANYSGYSSSSGRMSAYDENYVTLTTGNFYDVLSRTPDKRISSTLSNDGVYNAIASGNYTASYSPRYGLELRSDNNLPGISTANCVPHRRFADQYPNETALANSIGTRMFDVRYINNRAVNSRIDTTNVIAETIAGEQVTDLGFSGIGQLGEVVTFRDGTQRVEAILGNGHSVWLRTSGRLTIDEICNINAARGSLDGVLTPEESLIRDYGIKDALKSQASIRF